MAIEQFDKGICIAAFFCQYDPTEGANGSWRLYGQGASAIEALDADACACDVTLVDELAQPGDLLTPAEDPRHLGVVIGVMNKDAPLPGPAAIVTWAQLPGQNVIRFECFTSAEATSRNEVSFYAQVFRLPLPFVDISAIAPGGA